MFKIFRSAVMAGFTVGLAAFGYLCIGGVVGAVVFAFGLLTVVAYRLSLFTGTAGFIKKNEVPSLLLILLGNVIGCLIVSLMTRVSANDLQSAAQGIIQSRIDNGAVRSGVLAIGCGFIMTTVVTFAREGKPLALLFGVPLFIYCGFPHCLADAFYYITVPTEYTFARIGEIAMLYPCLVIGNFVGCNLYRFIAPKQ